MSDLIRRFKAKYRYSIVVFKELVKTDFQLRYQGSFLGVLWSVLKPLMLFAVMYMVFVRFLRFSDGTPTFAISLLCGTCLWSFFSEATTMGMQKKNVDCQGIVKALRKEYNDIVWVSASLDGSRLKIQINTVA